jgi:hypothetical protein
MPGEAYTRNTAAIPLDASRIDEAPSTPPAFPRFTLRDDDPPAAPREPQTPMEALEDRVWALEVLVDRLIQLVTQEVMGRAIARAAQVGEGDVPPTIS